LGGRYNLTRRVARGGMAEVWEANDDVLARQVAVKVLLPHLAADEVFVTRFRMEAVAAARLSHPNIVAVYDTFRDDDAEGIVMELVRGTTLRRVLDEQRALSVSRSVSIGIAVADALEHAHRSQLVHRDVKPGNILLAESGRVMVTDFGIAKAVHDTTDGHDLTDTGTVLGTVKYLSPEQVEGNPIDARSDVFSLGCVLYEMVCGRPPFEGGTAMATAMARVNERPLLPRQCRPGVPRAFESVIVRALSRDPEARYGSAGELASALRSIHLELDPDEEISGPVLAVDPTVTSSGDRTPPGGVALEPRFTQTERSWIVPAALIVLIAVALGTAGVLIGRTDVGREIFEGAREAVTGERDSSGPPPAIVEAHSFDPFGSGGEHDGEVGNLLDGNPNTTWSTEHYDTSDFGGLKEGVGVILVLKDEGSLGELEVLARSQGWAAEVYIAPQAATDLAGWGEPVGTASALGDSHAFDLQGRSGRAVLLWITGLGDGGRAELAELTLRS